MAKCLKHKTIAAQEEADSLKRKGRMTKTGFIKVWKAFLGIVTEVMMTIFIMAVALGLCWLIARGWG